MNPLVWNFGAVEAALGVIHGIAASKRTAFQSRIKNLHRLRFPIGFETSKGRASEYHPGHIVEVALALEMTQLGLPPERVVHVLALNRFPTFMALQMASRSLEAFPQGFVPDIECEDDPGSMFLYFDPAALSLLMQDNPKLTPDIDYTDDTFFYGGAAVVRDNLVRWTSGDFNRLSLINLTSMIDMVALAMCPAQYDEAESIEFKRRFFAAVRTWSDEKVEETYEHDAEYFAGLVVTSMLPKPSADEETAQAIADETGLRIETILKVLSSRDDDDDSDP